jgi:DNA topoisomerase-3
VLAQGYHLIDSGLVLPVARASIESECDAIAAGSADKDAVVAKALSMFRDKFDNFIRNIAKMDVLFGSRYEG